MAEVEEQGGSKGLSRRQMIKASAIAGAAAWTAPVIVDSLSSPAAAASGSFPTGCSYALFVFYVNGAGPYIARVGLGESVCSFSNSTSNDDQFTAYSCNGHTYAGGNGTFNDMIWQDGTAVPVYPGPQSCTDFFTIQGSTIVEKQPAVATIVFSTSHHGGSGGYQGNKFFPVCPTPASESVTVDCN